MAWSESALSTEWVNPVRFPDGNNVNLVTVRELIQEQCNKHGIPVAFRDDQVKVGGLFNKQLEDVLYMYNPSQEGYLKFIIRVQHMGTYAFMHVYNMGGSKNYKAVNTAGSGGFIGGLTSIGNILGGRNAKLNAEEQYYTILKDCLENILA